MSTYTPKAGDEVYSIDGDIGLYVSTAKGGGYIVQPLIEDGDGYSEPAGLYADGVAIWPTVYREPPQPKLDAEIRAQQEKLTALRREVAEIERQKREAERDGAALKERLGMHQALAVLDDLLSGRVTHYVLDDSENSNRRWRVVPAEEFFKLRTSYNRCALSLWAEFNTRGAVVRWKFSPNWERADDGRSAYAFTSEEAAHAKMVELVTREIDETAKFASNSYWLKQRIEWGKAQGIEPSAEAAEKLAQLERTDAEHAAKKAREDLAKAQAALDALGAA